MNKKTIIIGIIAIIILATIAGSLIWKKNNLKKQEQTRIQEELKRQEETKKQEEQKKEEKNISEENVNEEANNEEKQPDEKQINLKKKKISGWEVYINTKYKYLIQYPTDDNWNFFNEDGNSQISERERQYLRLANFNFDYRIRPLEKNQSIITVYVLETDKTLNQIVEKSLSKKEEKLGGIRFFKMDGNKERPSWEGGTEDTLTYVTVNGGYYYGFLIKPGSKISKKTLETFETIISSLEFTD